MIITLVDWIIWIFYFIVLFGVLVFYRQAKTGNPIYKWFLKGFLIKVFGGLFFGLIYVYYYGFGDTLEYWKGAAVVGDVLFNSPSDYIDLLFSEGSKIHAGHLSGHTTQNWRLS